MIATFPIREMELEKAANRPILSGTPMRMADPSELYPYVYDSLAKARLSSAFVASVTVRELIYTIRVSSNVNSI